MKGESIYQFGKWGEYFSIATFFIILFAVSLIIMVIDIRKVKNQFSIKMSVRLVIMFFTTVGLFWIAKGVAWDSPYRIAKTESQIKFEYILRKSKQIDATDRDGFVFHKQRLPPCIILMVGTEIIRLPITESNTEDSIKSFLKD